MSNNYIIVRHLGIKGRSDCYLIKYADGRQGIRLKTLYKNELLERNVVSEHKVQAIVEYFDRISIFGKMKGKRRENTHE